MASFRGEGCDDGNDDRAQQDHLPACCQPSLHRRLWKRLTRAEALGWDSSCLPQILSRSLTHGLCPGKVLGEEEVLRNTVRPAVVPQGRKGEILHLTETSPCWVLLSQGDDGVAWDLS